MKPRQLGTLITLASPEIADALAITGVDWVFVDMEHSPAIDPTAVLHIVQAIGGRADVFVRVPVNDEVWIKKSLDAGADGVIVPHVVTQEDATRAVHAAKYPPLGRRSVGITPAHGYGSNFQSYLANANSSTRLVVQIEDIEAMKNLDAILGVEGVDAAFVGPYDLSGSMGKLGQLADPEVQSTIDTIIEKCRSAGVPLGIYASDVAGARQALDRGVDFVAVGTEVGLLMSAMRDVLSALNHPRCG
ncbi:MAG TPA: aldolase/citrate lyase family protein [Candidatus Limnocylindrales bacterium]|nr:aldolase/citrate lyase family protein [Candidatus Limnocylindrales bacterium]